MCGRYVLATDVDEVARYFHAVPAPGVAERFTPSWNVAPTRQVLGVACDADGGRVVADYRWGLVPPWAKDLSAGKLLFNARAETVATKPAFRAAFGARRLAVVADGFYEWRKGTGKERYPFYLYRADGAPLAFAGLWELWRDREPEAGPAGGSWIRSCTIITTAANVDVAPLHDRMPVVLGPEELAAWLEPGTGAGGHIEALLAPAPAGTLVRRPVDRRVGNTRLDGPSLLEAVDTTLAFPGPLGTGGLA